MYVVDTGKVSKVWSVLEEGYALVEYVNAAKEPM